MPTYNYICESCGAEKEEVRRISDMETPTKEPCWNCGEYNSVRRKIYANMGFNADPNPTKYKNAFRETMDRIKKKNPINNIPNY